MSLPDFQSLMQSVIEVAVERAALKAGAVAMPRRGYVQANERSRSLLAAGQPVTNQTLSQFAEFRDWLALSRGQSSGDAPDGVSSIPNDPLTPRETIERAHAQLRQEVVDEVLGRVRAMDPTDFERLVLELVSRLGYGGPLGDREHVGRSGDGGIDGVIREDRLGLDHVYLQAKRWGHPVSRPDVQAFVGSLEGFRANKGILLTTSRFTQDARDYVGQIQKRIVLIDGELLGELMWEVGLGFTTDLTFAVKTVDNDYFDRDI